MAINDFIVNLVAGLSKTKSKQQIKSDAKSLGDMYVKLIGNLDMPKTRKAIKEQLKGLNNLRFNITPNVNTKGVQSATKQAINNAQRVADSNKVHLNFDTSKQQLINMIKILGRNNNKLFSDREMTAKYNQLLNSANVAKSTGELKTLRGELSAFKTELVATNNAGMTWGSKFKESIKSYAKFFSGASMIYALSNQVRNAATEAKTLDDSLVDLQKVTDEIGDRDALYKYFDKSLSKAQELNVKVGSLIDAVTEFKKLGWDLDDAELGAKWANILANVGDVDIDTAIGSIKTSIASFNEIGGYGNDQMDKKLEAYTDLINNMSNKYSIDAEGLAESIRLSAGTLTEAHMSIEQAATMFATANKYYSDPSYLGNTAKIGSLRMRASSGDTDAIEELQEMGEEVDDLATATSNLREKLMALTGVDIMEDEHTFKSYYDQLYEISQVMDKLDDTSRANVLETMFGKSRSAAGAAILSGMKESASAYEDAINSAGSATEEYQTWMTSADAACQRFSNTLTETYQGIINGNTVRDLANLGSAVLEFANNWGIVEGTLKGVIALNLGKFIATGGMALITATKQVEQYGKALQMASNVPNGNLSARFQALKSIAQATSTLTTEQLRNVLATNTLTQADRVRILQMQGMTKEMALQKLAEMNLTQATNQQTAANNASTASTFSLKAAMTGLGATLKSVFLSNPVGIVLMGISLGVSAVTSAVSKHNQAVEEARQKAKEAADNANTLGDEIAELANKYIQLSDAVKTDASAKEDLMTTQTELLKKLGLEGESIDDLIAKYGSLSNAIKQASIDSLKDQQIDLIAGVDAAREELIKAGKDAFGSDSWKKSIVAMGKEAGKAWQVLEDAGIISSGTHTDVGGEWFLSGDASEQGVLENYKAIEKALEALRDSNKFTQEELSQNDLFKELYDRYNIVKEAAESYDSEIDNLNENLAQQTMLTALQGNELPKTEEDFNKFKQELIDTAVASKQFIGNEKEITDAINNYLSTVPEFEGYYSIPLENELDKVDELLLSKPFSTLFDGSDFGDRLTYLNDQFKAGKITAHDYFESIRSELANTDFSEFTDQAAAAQQFFTDSIQQMASSLSDLINNYSDGNISATEYLDGYLSMAETLSDLTDNLQENSAAWNENGEAISNGTSQSLNTAQSQLANAIQGIEQYQDSIYSLEQIMSGTIKSGTDEFTAHTQVIAEDLAYIVQTGGKMAEQIASAMGTTTEEIASNLTDNVDNQAIAAQAIATNTNTSIGQMAQAVGNLLDTLGESIKNFKVDITFGVKGITTQDANLGILGKVKIPAIKFGITANGESLNAIGDAVSSFGKTLMSNISSQMVDYKKFSSIPTDSKGNEKTYTPSKDVTNNYNNKLNDIKNVDKAAKDAEKAAEDAHKAAKEELDAYLKYEEARFNAGVIDFQEYLKKRSGLIQKYYDEAKITAEEYYSELKEMYEAQLAIYDKALSAVTKLLEDEVDKIDKSIDAINKKNDALNEEKEKYDNIISAVEDLFDSETDKINEQIDALEEKNDKLGEEQEKYENVLSAIDKVYDTQIEAYNKEKDDIQDIIDGLQEENDEREREIALMKARYELERAQNQRTQYVYQDGQMVYKADESAIRDAKDALDEAEFNKATAELNKQIEEIEKNIEALEKMKEKWQEVANARKEALEYQAGVDMFGDKFTEYILNSGDKDIDDFLEKYNKVLDAIDDNTELIKGYNEKIKYYEKLKKNWTDLSSQHEKNVNKQLATEKFGAEWEAKVLSGRLEEFESFKNRYLQIQDEVTNNEKLIKDLETKKTYYEELKEQWSSVSSAYEDGMKKQIAAMILGEDWEKKVLDNRKGVFEDFKNNYINIQHQIANATIDAAQAAINAAQSEAEAMQNSLGNTVGYINTVSDEYKKAAKDMEETTKNLSNQQKALSKFGTNGRFGTVEKFAKGGVVGENNDPTVKKLAQSMGEDTLVAAKVGERILTPEQSKHFEELVDAKTGATYTPVNIIKKLGRVDMERAMQNMRSAQSNLYSNLVANNNAVNSSAIPNYVKEVNVDQHITLTLPNVTNNAGVEYLQKTLSNMTQKAYQMINKH